MLRKGRKCYHGRYIAGCDLCKNGNFTEPSDKYGDPMDVVDYLGRPWRDLSDVEECEEEEGSVV